MNTFDPNDGWREVPPYTEPDGQRYVIEFDESGDDQRMWVLEKTVPPLPTVRDTVIEARFALKGPSRLVCDGDGYWSKIGPVNGGRGGWAAHVLQAAIVDYVVLAEPPVATAEAVLDEVRSGLQRNGNVNPEDLYQVGKRYGVLF